MTDPLLHRLGSIRERLALWIAPWLYVPYREDREEAFKDLAEIAYLSRDAVWTSPRTLVHVALEESARKAQKKILPELGATRCALIQMCGTLENAEAEVQRHRIAAGDGS